MSSLLPSELPSKPELRPIGDVGQA